MVRVSQLIYFLIIFVKIGFGRGQIRLQFTSVAISPSSHPMFIPTPEIFLIFKSKVYNPRSLLKFPTDWVGAFSLFLNRSKTPNSLFCNEKSPDKPFLLGFIFSKYPTLQIGTNEFFPGFFGIGFSLVLGQQFFRILGSNSSKPFCFYEKSPEIAVNLNF